MFGALISLCVFYNHGWNIRRAVGEIIVICLICIIANLFPDVDTKSYSQKVIYIMLTVVNIYTLAIGKYTTSALIGLAAMAPMLTNHRGNISTALGATNSTLMG